jgi:CRP-like cAMP-binding protein
MNMKDKPQGAEAAASPHVLQKLVGHHSFLTGMSPQHLEALADCAMEAEFAPGELIFHEGDMANRFYLIQKGRVALESDENEMGAIPIQTLGPGDVLGWSWLFPPYYWHFDARATKPTDAIFFYGTRLRELCEQDHHLGYELMRRTANVVIKRLMATRKQLIRDRGIS